MSDRGMHKGGDFLFLLLRSRGGIVCPAVFIDPRYIQGRN